MRSAALCILFLSSFSYSLPFIQQNVYEELWNEHIDIANETLHVDFVQQMENNSLQAERYVSFTLQDINYLLEVTEMLKEMSERAQIPKEIRNFMTGRYKSYNDFLNYLLNENFLKDAPSIKPTPAMIKYLATYREVMEEDPIYFAVALLPCARLWMWLANNLDIPETNVYYTWKKGNIDGHPEKHYKDLLNKFLNTPEKIKFAHDVFSKQMQNERDFFATS